MNRPLRPLSENDRFHLRLARELRPLLQTEGWKLYTQLLREHKMAKEKSAMAIAGSVDEALRSNADKGAVLAFTVCLDLPASIIRIADEIASQRQPDEEDEA